MTETTDIAPRVTKSAAVTKLLSRPKGATLDEITTATGWQPHSARAFLTGLRKKAVQLDREQRRDGTTSYRIPKAEAAAKPAPISEQVDG